MARVLKPTGSIFVNLSDTYASSAAGGAAAQGLDHAGRLGQQRPEARDPERFGRWRRDWGVPRKSLVGLPWRYALACIDQLGLILRKDIIWHKPNPLPTSVKDRVGDSHEYWFHLVTQPRYYAAVDELREPHSPTTHPGHQRSVASHSGNGARHRTFAGDTDTFHPLGKLPGSVWSVPSEPLRLPAWIDTAHYAAFPTEWPRRLILGWSPPGICLDCGHGRTPVVDRPGLLGEDNNPASRDGSRSRSTMDGGHREWAARMSVPDRIVGYACACTPHTDHPGTGEPSGQHGRYAEAIADGHYPENFGKGIDPHANLSARPKVGPWRHYHLDRWTPPPTRPAVVLDPFSGTGTTIHVAAALGRIGIGCDLSAAYNRIAADQTLAARRAATVTGRRNRELQGVLAL